MGLPPCVGTRHLVGHFQWVEGITMKRSSFHLITVGTVVATVTTGMIGGVVFATPAEILTLGELSNDR
jgi:hypothetical protein